MLYKVDSNEFSILFQFDLIIYLDQYHDDLSSAWIDDQFKSNVKPFDIWIQDLYMTDIHSMKYRFMNSSLIHQNFSSTWINGKSDFNLLPTYFQFDFKYFAE
jgi:hypothetical protein